MAFQPIIDTAAGDVWGYEALVRGAGGEGAGSILSRVAADQIYRFDQACRVKAIELAAKLFRRSDLRLSINFMPNAIYEPSACLRTTLSAARSNAFPLNAIMFEFTEREELADIAHLELIIEEYRRVGFITALDDFGAGFSGLALLANFQPDLIKVDMELVRDIDSSYARQSILAGILSIARDLRIAVLAEGVETAAEFNALKAAGVTLFQGYYFAKPAFEALPANTIALELLPEHGPIPAIA
ncbi:EAL domain-containing protein [Jiella sp. MQZ9-1]|uniref:EAL domain-containing protein n=1 Tax=Jiella flava TaxID=2816857 RepID=A0A939FXT1_9HYPH|nr:EAL domain-containing protein [Jiella flava]MBO0663953.1 EAL domain-containing protein [Jiella flava]MCD2472524.1 EAL domain-containing protein [Jiella flava]